MAIIYNYFLKENTWHLKWFQNFIMNINKYGSTNHNKGKKEKKSKANLSNDGFYLKFRLSKLH